jgi:hypothetical protein
MSTHSACRTVGTAVLTVALLVVSGGASAATRTFTDPDDSDTIDIRAVRVAYANWMRVRVKHDGPIEAGQVYAFWIDTRRRNPGPEYYTSFRPNAEVEPLNRVSGFNDPTRTPIACEKVAAAADIGRPRAAVRLRVGGDCLGDPDRVRISVNFRNPDGLSADWAPARRQLYPPVRRD